MSTLRPRIVKRKAPKESGIRNYYLVYLPQDRGEMSYRTDTKTDAQEWVRRHYSKSKNPRMATKKKKKKPSAKRNCSKRNSGRKPAKKKANRKPATKKRSNSRKKKAASRKSNPSATLRRKLAEMKPGKWYATKVSGVRMKVKRNGSTLTLRKATKR